MKRFIETVSHAGLTSALKTKCTETLSTAAAGLASVFSFMMLAPQRALACTSEAPTHNAYLFSAFPRNLMLDQFGDKTDAFWRAYSGSADKYFSFSLSSDDLLKSARQRGDREMATYIGLLRTYLKDNQLLTGWDYPTREQLRQRTLHLQQMVNAGNAYRGKRLRQQYALMKMRGLFGLKQYRQAASYWLSTGQRLPESVYRERMENIYAGSLLRLGKKREAVEIYARQQDYTSLKYCVRNYRNLAGIQKVYAESPNSATLTYLVQDFVNNTQESMDALADRYATATASAADSDLVSGMDLIDAKLVYRQDAQQFVDFARTVLREKKTLTPCLWQSAIGCIHHLMGDYRAADSELRAALTLAGTLRMKDNARAILAVNEVHTTPLGPDFYTLTARNLRWLDSLSQAETYGDYQADHYAQVKERLIYRNLEPLLRQAGKQALALALIGVENVDNYASAKHSLYYGCDYVDELLQQSPDELAAYYNTLTSAPGNDLEDYAYTLARQNADFYNDLIGTRMLANGRFAEAVPYLEKVSLDFLSKQAIAPYAAHKNWNSDRWMVKQKMPDGFWNGAPDDGLKLTNNKKLDFCREMVRQESLYRNMRDGQERREQAYRLASLYYQASYEGDCWWLTQYGVSSMQDSALVATKDFVAQAISLLEPLTRPLTYEGLLAQAPDKKAAKAMKKAFKAKYGDDRDGQFERDVLDLRQKSLYALAFIHRDPWYFYGWDEKTSQWYDYDNLRVNKSSRQYKALLALSIFATENSTALAPYISRCDVLKRFEAAR